MYFRCYSPVCLLIKIFRRSTSQPPAAPRPLPFCHVTKNLSPYLLYYLHLQTPFCKSLVFYSLRLPSSVSRKSFICHSYENCRVYINNSHPKTYSSSPSNMLALSFRSLCPIVCPPAVDMLGFALQKSPGPAPRTSQLCARPVRFVSLQHPFGAERLCGKNEAKLRMRPS